MILVRKLRNKLLSLPCPTFRVSNPCHFSADETASASTHCMEAWTPESMDPLWVQLWEHQVTVLRKGGTETRPLLPKNLCSCYQTHVRVCPTHSEAKQTETLEFGAEKGLLQGQARRTGGSCPKTLDSSKGFSKVLLKARQGRGITGYGISLCTILWLVDGEVTGQCPRG